MAENNMVIKMDVNKKAFCRQLFGFLNQSLNCRPAELDILALFATIYMANPTASYKTVFSTKTRKAIRLALMMGEPTFNNHISSLKKKGYIVNKEDGIDLANYLKVQSNKNEYNLLVKFKFDGK